MRTVADTKPLSPRQLGVIWIVALALVPLYIWIAEANGKAFDGHFTWWHWTVAVLAVWSAEGGFSVRRKLLARATVEAANGNEMVASKTWSTAQLIGVVSAHAVALWGFNGKMFLGCPHWFCAPFYVAGVVLLILWKPRQPPFVFRRNLPPLRQQL